MGLGFLVKGAVLFFFFFLGGGGWMGGAGLGIGEVLFGCRGAWQLAC